MHFLGKNIRYLRKRSAQKQDEIARLVNKGQTTIGNWENGVSEPSLDDLLIISNYFGISVDILLRSDLARGEARAETALYDHEQTTLSMVQEDPEDRLSPILEEIRTIRSEIEHIKSRLPGEI